MIVDRFFMKDEAHARGTSRKKEFEGVVIGIRQKLASPIKFWRSLRTADPVTGWRTIRAGQDYPLMQGPENIFSTDTKWPVIGGHSGRTRQVQGSIRASVRIELYRRLSQTNFRWYHVFGIPRVKKAFNVYEVPLFCPARIEMHRIGLSLELLSVESWAEMSFEHLCWWLHLVLLWTLRDRDDSQRKALTSFEWRRRAEPFIKKHCTMPWD